MLRDQLTVMGAAMLVASGLSGGAASAPAQKTVVLVHGAFADGSSWRKVIPLLEAKGLNVVAVQNPLSSLSADVDAARRVIEAQPGPVILVGHSWAGMVISEAGMNDKVKALVYVAAFEPRSHAVETARSRGRHHRGRILDQIVPRPVREPRSRPAARFVRCALLPFCR